MHEMLDAQGLEDKLACLLIPGNGSPFAFHLAKVHPVECHLYNLPLFDVLKRGEVASGVARLLRCCDAFARIAPDKFAVVQRRKGVKDRVSAFADKISTQLPLLAGADGDGFACSVGTVEFAEQCATPFQLMQAAELALAAQRRKRIADQSAFNGFPFKPRSGIHAVTQALHEALAQEQFELFYQPIVSATTRSVVQYEALIRWRHPSQRTLSPVHFIPAAEYTGVINDIGCWALNRACMEILAHDSCVGVAVNISPTEFLTSDVSMKVERALEDTGLHPTRLTIELTENVSMPCSGEILRQFERIKDMGVKLGLDDFGAGYSSLARLHELPIHCIKIDRSLISPITRCDRSRKVVSGILKMAAELDLVTVAEGVEVEEQADILRDAGATWLQGYYFGVPAPASTALQERKRFGRDPCGVDDATNPSTTSNGARRHRQIRLDC